MDGMALYIETRHRTRFSDIDTQRHVTSRTYESFCFDARFQLLEHAGQSMRALAEAGSKVLARDSFVKFVREQGADAELVVRTWAFPEADGNIFWDHLVEEPDGTLVCHITNRTRALDVNGDPITLLASTEQPAPHAPDGRDPARLYAEDIALFEPIAPFQGGCKRLLTRLPALYSGRNIFGSYSTGELWRVFEDGRWFFSERMGLTYRKFVELDTILFFMGAVFQFGEMPVGGQELEVYTWVERIDKIRAYLRQDVHMAGGSAPILSVRENSLVVSLTRARPKKPPPEYFALVADYLEFPPA